MVYVRRYQAHHPHGRLPYSCRFVLGGSLDSRRTVHIYALFQPRPRPDDRHPQGVSRISLFMGVKKLEPRQALAMTGFILLTPGSSSSSTTTAPAQYEPSSLGRATTG